VIGYLPLLSLLLPLKVTALAGEARLGVLTATVIAGALAASISNIVFGWLSDRSLARGGGRRRWLAGGVVATALGFVAVAAAASPLQIVLAIVLFQLAVNAVIAPLLAIMADEIPDAQKGIAGGLLTLAYPVAAAVTAALVGISLLGEAARFAIVPLVVAICVAPLLASRPLAVAATADTPQRRQIHRREFVVLAAARLLVQIAGNVQSAYLLYYFESIAPADAEGVAASVGNVLTLAFVLPLPIALLVGRWSDRSGRRRPFLVAAALVAALGLAGMAVADSWTGAATAFCVYGIGSAVFLALHSGFAMQLLPSARHRGRDLGLLNLTNTLPALLGPLLAWLLATPRDFDALMLALAALTLCGGMAILAARGDYNRQ
jgi:MFS family permease